MHHYESRVVADQATGKALVGRRVTVEDAETGAPVQPYRDGQPITLVTGAYGLLTEWQTEETTRRVALTAGPVRLTQWCVELIGASGEAITELERLTISHIAFDDDGVPAISPGSDTARVLTDVDGTPVVVPAQAVAR